MPWEPINLQPGERLGYGRGPDGGRIGMIFDADNHYSRPAVWEEVDGPSYQHSSQEPVQPRPRTPEQQALADLLSDLLVLTIIKLSPIVKRWWDDTFLPAAGTAIKRLVESIKTRKRSIEPTQLSIVYIATKTDPRAAIAATEITMTKAEWAKRYQSMLDASSFSEEERRLLSVARIIEAEGDLKARLTPQQFAERVQLKIEANPVILEEKRSADVIRAITSDGGRRVLGQ